LFYKHFCLYLYYNYKQNKMENLLQLLDENLEQVNHNLWAEWLDDSQKDVLSVNGMLKALDLNHLKNVLLEAEASGLLKLDVDDRALLVELL